VSTVGNSLTKTASTAWGNSGASSTQAIASGNGYVEFTASETSSHRMVGLSTVDSDQNYTSIGFAIYPAANGVLNIYESGVHRGAFGTYASGDALRVAVESGVVKYRKNGTLLYTSLVTPSYPLLVDTALYENGATLSNVVISGASGAGGGNGGVSWLVTDHLGTPRMIIDQTGTLANVKRHDYLPFGEELFAGGRISSLGYAGDGVRQKFTAKERDIETGLDYFLARYYSSSSGRFTSADSFGGFARNPQTLNLYAYVQGNPLAYRDPSGHFAIPSAEDDPCEGQPLCQKREEPPKKETATEAVNRYLKRLWDVTTDWKIWEKEAEKEREPDPTPMPSADKIMDAHTKTIIAGSEINIAIITTADPTGISGFVDSVIKKDKVGTGLAVGAMLPLGRFGWVGGKMSNEAVKILQAAGTHEELLKVIPTRQEAEKLIALSQGRIDRIERAHRGLGHPYPHINYTTRNGEKATIRVASVGKQFRR